MKKFILIIVCCIMVTESFILYKVYNQKNLKNVVAAEPQKIIFKDKIVYRDKIIYKNSSDIKKILFQTSLFLYNTKKKNSNNNYIDNSGQCSYTDNLKSRFKNGTEVLNTSFLLKQITLYNNDNFH